MVHQTWLRRIRVGDPTELSLVGHSFRPHDNFLVHVRTLTCVARALVVNTLVRGTRITLAIHPKEEGTRQMRGSSAVLTRVDTMTAPAPPRTPRSHRPGVLIASNFWLGGEASRPGM